MSWSPGIHDKSEGWQDRTSPIVYEIDFFSLVALIDRDPTVLRTCQLSYARKMSLDLYMHSTIIQEIWSAPNSKNRRLSGRRL